MFMLAMAPRSLPSCPRRAGPPVPLLSARINARCLLQVFGHLLEYILEHQIGIEPGALGHRAEGGGVLPAGRNQNLEFSRQRLMTRFRPFAQLDQVLFEPLDGIAQGPVFMIILGPVARRVVAGGMRGRAIRHQFDQRRPRPGARAFCRPLRHGIHRQKVVAVDANARDAVPRTARGE